MSLVAVDGERRVRPELRNGFAIAFGFGEEELKWHPQKRGGSSLLRCEGRACGGDALTHKESHTVTLLVIMVLLFFCGSWLLLLLLFVALV